MLPTKFIVVSVIAEAVILFIGFQYAVWVVGLDYYNDWQRYSYLFCGFIVIIQALYLTWNLSQKLNAMIKKYGNGK